MSSSSRTLLCAPSAPTRYFAAQPALSAASLPYRHGDAIGVLRHADHLVPVSTLAPASARAPQDRLEAGLGAEQPPARAQRVDALVEARDDVGELLARERVHHDERAFGLNSLGDCRRTLSSMPAQRNISSVRMWKKAARGNCEPPAAARPRARRCRAGRETSRSTGRPVRRRRSEPDTPARSSLAHARFLAHESAFCLRAISGTFSASTAGPKRSARPRPATRASARRPAGRSRTSRRRCRSRNRCRR